MKKKVKKATLAHYADGTAIVKIEFPYHPPDITVVKRIPGRKWHPNARLWTCPPSSIALKILYEAGFLIEKKLQDFVLKPRSYEMIDIPGLKRPLFKYQNHGVSFLQKRNGRALIADEMGLGKTIQALAWLQLNPEKRPVVIVCAASAKLNWYREIMSWMTIKADEVEIISGTTPYILGANLLLINYDILDAWLPTLIRYNPQVVIADEVQYVKSGKALRTKALRKLTKRVPHFIALSGTPLVNRPIEFFNAIQMVDANLFPNWMDYTKRYCNRKHNGFGWNVNGASNTKELHEILSSSIMIRRLKSEVLTDLPPKIRSFYPLEMDPNTETDYWEAENNFLRWLEQHRGASAAERASEAEKLAQVTALRQMAVRAKMRHAIDWIKDFLTSGEKLVIFTMHRFVVKELMDAFKDVAVKIEGGDSVSNRQNAIDKFQNEEGTRLFIGNVKAAGHSITLTAASNVAFIELPWTPGEVVQAEDRCHRIGQKRTVNVYYLLAEQTIEEKIASLLDEKRKVLDSVLDGVETDEKSLLMELIENY